MRSTLLLYLPFCLFLQTVRADFHIMFRRQHGYQVSGYADSFRLCPSNGINTLCLSQNPDSQTTSGFCAGWNGDPRTPFTCSAKGFCHLGFDLDFTQIDSSSRNLQFFQHNDTGTPIGECYPGSGSDTTTDTNQGSIIDAFDYYVCVSSLNATTVCPRG
jgi:hypothetical protein